MCVIVFERRPTVVTSVCGLPDFWFGEKLMHSRQAHTSATAYRAKAQAHAAYI